MDAKTRRCLNCGRSKGLLSLNWAGQTDLIHSVKFPGNSTHDYLCTACKDQLQPALLEEANRKDGNIQKPRERQYKGLNVALDVVLQEIMGYLAMKGYRNPELRREETRTVITADDFAIIVSGTPDDFDVMAGPRKVVDPVAVAVLLGPLGWLIKGAGVLYDKKKVDDLFAFLDDKLYARAQPQASQESREDIPSRLRELAKLREDGILTDEEFQAKKAELLARM